MAVALAVGLLTVPTPATADGSMAPGATKTMTLSNGNGGTGLALGDIVTVEFDVVTPTPIEPVGDFFDIWFCPDTLIAPVDGGSANGECEDVTFWERDTSGTATNVAVTDASKAVKVNALTLTWVFGIEDSPAYFAYPGDPYGGLYDDVSGIDGDDFCGYVGWYLIVHDYSGGNHSNFLGPLAPTGCEPAARSGPVPPVMVCSPDPVVPGGSVTCEVSGGPVDHEALWRASFDGSVFASTGVMFGPDGFGSFSFVAPRGAACGSVTVELVEWLPPITVTVACGPIPTRIPAGEGGLPLGAGLLGLVGAAGALLVGRRLVTAG